MTLERTDDPDRRRRPVPHRAHDGTGPDADGACGTTGPHARNAANGGAATLVGEPSHRRSRRSVDQVSVRRGRRIVHTTPPAAIRNDASSAVPRGAWAPVAAS